MNTTPDAEAAQDPNEILTALLENYLGTREAIEEYEEMIRNNEDLKEKALSRSVDLRGQLEKFEVYDGAITVVVDKYAATLRRRPNCDTNEIIICPVLVAK